MAIPPLLAVSLVLAMLGVGPSPTQRQGDLYQERHEAVRNNHPPREEEGNGDAQAGDRAAEQAERTKDDETDADETSGEPLHEQAWRVWTELDPDTKSNALLAVFTGMLVIVGALQGVLLWHNARTTRRLERPWVIVEPLGQPEDLEVGLRLEESHKIVTFTITNHGRSPAWITSISAKCLLVVDPHPVRPVKPRFAASDTVADLWQALPPGRPYQRGTAVKVASAEREAIEQWRATFVLTGRVMYRDAFRRRPHKTIFHRTYRPSPLGGSWGDGPQRYNRCT